MAATDRYSLIVESSTRGEQELRRFEATMNRVADVVEKSQKRMGDGSKKVGDDTRQFAASLKNFISNPLAASGQAVETFVLKFGKLGAGLAVGAAGLGTVGVAAFKLVKEVGAAAEEIVNLADRTGLSVGQVDKFKAAADIAGVSAESLSSASRKLASFLQDTSSESAKAREEIQKLGVSFFDTAGNQKDLDAVTLQLIERLGAAGTQTERVALAQKVFGKGALELLPLIRNYKELNIAVTGLGFGFEDGLIPKLAKADDEIDKLGKRWELLKRQLAGKIVGTIEIIRLIGEAVGPTEGQGRRTEGGFNEAEALSGRPSGEQLARDRENKRKNDEALQAFEKRTAAAPLVDAFRRRDALTIASGQRRLAEIQDEQQQKRTAILSGDLDTSAVREKERQLAALERERKIIEHRIKVEQKRLAKLEALAEFEFVPDKQPRAIAPSLFTPKERIRGTGAQGDFRDRELPISAFVAAGENAPITPVEQTPEFLAIQSQLALDAGFAKTNRQRELGKRTLEQELDLETRRIQLLLGPGGEAEAIVRISSLRLAGLERAKALGADLFEIDLERSRILQERELDLLQLQRRRVDDFRESVGQGIDALLARGGAGLTDFLLTIPRQFAKTVSQNLAVELFSGIANKVAIPGQKGDDGKPNLLGRILTGTPFADQGVKPALDLNTLATIKNTVAMQTLAGGIGGYVSKTPASFAAALGLPGKLLGIGGSQYPGMAVSSGTTFDEDAELLNLKSETGDGFGSIESLAALPSLPPLRARQSITTPSPSSFEDTELISAPEAVMPPPPLRSAKPVVVGTPERASTFDDGAADERSAALLPSLPPLGGKQSRAEVQRSAAEQIEADAELINRRTEALPSLPTLRSKQEVPDVEIVDRNLELPATPSPSSARPLPPLRGKPREIVVSDTSAFDEDSELLSASIAPPLPPLRPKPTLSKFDESPESVPFPDVADEKPDLVSLPPLRNAPSLAKAPSLPPLRVEPEAIEVESAIAEDVELLTRRATPPALPPLRSQSGAPELRSLPPLRTEPSALEIQNRTGAFDEDLELPGPTAGTAKLSSLPPLRGREGVTEQPSLPPLRGPEEVPASVPVIDEEPRLAPPSARARAELLPLQSKQPAELPSLPALRSRESAIEIPSTPGIDETPEPLSVPSVKPEPRQLLRDALAAPEQPSLPPLRSKPAFDLPSLPPLRGKEQLTIPSVTSNVYYEDAEADSIRIETPRTAPPSLRARERAASLPSLPPLRSNKPSAMEVAPSRISEDAELLSAGWNAPASLPPLRARESVSTPTALPPLQSKSSPAVVSRGATFDEDAELLSIGGGRTELPSLPPLRKQSRMEVPRGSNIDEDAELISMQGGTTRPGFKNQYGSTGATAAVYGSAVVAGGFGVYSGVKQGGARGTLSAVSSGLATAAALDPEPVSKAVLLIASVAAGLATQILGDPKRKRDEALNKLIEGAAYTAPTSKEFNLDQMGRTYDYDRAGNTRAMGPPIIVQVQTMDAKSFTDHSSEIADSVRYAMERGHRINRTAQEVVLNQ